MVAMAKSAARVAAIELGLRSADPEEVYDAIIDIGKQGHPELADRVAPFLSSPTGFLRDAALRTLVFHLELPAYKADAIRMLDADPDPGAREAAAMGLGRFAGKDPELIQHLLRVAVNPAEQDIVRAAAFLAALVAAGIDRSEFPKAHALPAFDARADWALLARALGRAGIAIPPAVAERAARPR